MTNNQRRLIYGTLLTMFAIVIILGIIIFYSQTNSRLKIVFLNVGQGDAILIESGSNQLLIDGGKNSDKLLNNLLKFMPFWDKTIETVLVTHPDSDHFAGLIGLLENYQVKNIIRTNAESHSQNWLAFKKEITSENINQILGEKNVRLIFPNQATIQILYPFGNVPKYSRNTNLNSLVAKLVYGQNSFLFTGDLPFAGEEKLLASGIDLQSKVLKVGHHGSKYSTGDDFLDAVKPQDAVISVGAQNRYHHPSDIVIKKLKQRLIKVWRTDRNGNIVYDCSLNSCRNYAQP